jgi:DNA-directed RNA polymerase specialized sigma24 family protein
MDLDASVTAWIEGLRQGDQLSAQQMWERYFTQLVQVAGKKLARGIRRDFDEEDVALSAFHSLCVGVKEGKFPKLEDRDSLWSLLVVITARKAMHRMRTATTQEHGGGKVRGESVFLSRKDADKQGAEGINQVIGREPTAEFAAQVSEESERLLSLLPDEAMRKLALLKMEGFSNKETAEELQCGLRTIERRLSLIRKIWEAKS